MKKSGKHITMKNKSIKRLLFGVVMSALLLSACSKSDKATDDTQNVAANKVTEEDSKEAEGKSDGKIEKVVAISKSNAELWLLAGGELVATTDDAMELEGLSSDTQSLGDMTKVSLEAVVALEPDLIICFSTEPSQKALGEAAEEAGIKVFYTDIDDFADYDKALKELTELTGREDLYNKNSGDVKKDIDDIIAKVPEKNTGKKYLLLHVSATKSKVEKNDYFASEILNNLGLENAAGDDSAFNELSLEAVVAEDPDYIFVVVRGDEDKALSSFDELFTGKAAWESLSAVKNGNYYILDKDLFGLKPNARWAESYKQAYDLLYGK